MNRGIFKITKRKVSVALVGTLVLALIFAGVFRNRTHAADVNITYNGEILDPSMTYEMTTSSMQLMLDTTGTKYEDTDLYRVDWTIEDANQRDVIASINQGTSQTIGIVRALSPGIVTVTVTIRDATTTGVGAIVGTATCNIRVVFSVDTTTDDSIYKFVNPTDEKRSLVLYSDDGPVSLGLNFGEARNTQWTSANEEVATVEQNSGVVTPRGAGKTQITATYTPSGSGDTTYTAYLDVYVIPKVSETGEDGSYDTTLDVSLDSGGYLYTDSIFTNNLEVVRSKIVWVIKKDDANGNSTVIADSLGKTSSLISVNPTGSRTNQLQISGMAGEYDLYFYAYGSYNADLPNGTNAYTPTVVHLVIKSDIRDKDETISIGDMFDFAASFNMTTDDFLEHFSVSLSMAEGGSDYSNYASYDASKAMLTALAVGKIEAKLTVRKGQESSIRKLLGLGENDALPASFTINITITDKIHLNHTSLTIVVGQQEQLKLVLNNTYNGTTTWSSSDSSSVSVSESGMIKGLKVTKQDVVITATLDTGEGPVRTATCTVKVEATVTDFTLSPSDDQSMNIGDNLTVVASIKQTVTVAPLLWNSSDESVFKVSVSDDKKSAIITAVGGGNAVLTILNPINGEQKVLNIRVRIPINSISFANDSMEIPLYKAGYNMRNEVSWLPKNANDTELTWASSDTSVFEVDSDGYITFKGAGTALLQVYPTYNPYNVMASCLITIIGTPDKITLSQTDVTVNVGESQIVTLEFTPKNTQVGMTFSYSPSTGDQLVNVAYDESRSFLTITGKKPGTTVVNMVSSNGLVNPINVTVKQPSTAIAISPKSLTVRTDESAQLTTKFTPATSTDTVTYTSLDTGVAQVDAKGLVTGKKAGTTFIRVQAFNGKIVGATEVVQVTVLQGLKGVSLDSMAKSVNVGSTITLAPIFNPADAADQGMTWSSANSSIAKVELSGTSNAKVTGVKEGVTIITGTSNDGGFTVACLVTVTPAPQNDTKVTVSPKTKYLSLGKSFYVKATVTGSNNKKVKWTTSKKKTATVTSGGKVKGKKIGTVYIKATAKDGSGAYDRCKVRVVRKAKKVVLNKYSASILVGGHVKLKARVKPKKTTIKKVTWKSSDTSIAMVSGTGEVLGLKEGMVRITATTTDGSKKKATCLVTVKEPVEATGVTVANSSVTLAKGRAVQSGIVAAPANTTTGIHYYSDNPKVATVDKRGKIRTKKAGQATIYGETANGKVGYMDVQVVDLNRKGIVMRQYDTEQLHVNDISTGVTWYSKNINIASVDSNGLVTGRRKGTTTVYAVVNGVKLGCRVKIKKIK